MIGGLRTKAGVEFAQIQAGGFRLLGALEATAREMGRILTITCGTEGHGPTDPHTRGLAYDVSVLGMAPDDLVLLRAHLMEALPADLFTVLYEVPQLPGPGVLQAIATLNTRASAPHLHLQVRKGTVYPPSMLVTPETRIV